MDNLTHSLVGAVLGQAGLKRTTGLAMPALIIGANLPDVDAACFFWLKGTEHLAFRRGITHGPPALVLLPLILAGILWAFDRWQTKRGKRPEGRLPVRFGWLYAMAFVGCLSHPFFDWLNVYGIRLLEPFSSRWFYGDTLFIIDPWLWALLIGSVWWSRRREKRGGEWMLAGRVGIAAMLAYIGVNGAITGYELARYGSAVHGGDELISNPVPLAFWQRELVTGVDREAWFRLDAEHSGDRAGGGVALVAASRRCVWPDTDTLRKTDSQLDAFLFWSRAPFAEANEDGSVILRDARYYDSRVKDRFSLPLPDVPCEPLGEEPTSG